MNKRLARFVLLTDRNSILNEFIVNKNGDFDFRPVVHSLVMMFRRSADSSDETIVLNHKIVAALMATKVFQEQPRKINTEIAELCVKFGSAAAPLVDFMVKNFKRYNAVAGVQRLVITEEYLGFLALWLEKTDWPLPFRYSIQRQDKRIVASNIDLLASMIGFAVSRGRFAFKEYCGRESLYPFGYPRAETRDDAKWFINSLYERWPDELVLKFMHLPWHCYIERSWYIRDNYDWKVPSLAVWARIQWAHFFELALTLAPLGLPHYVVLWLVILHSVRVHGKPFFTGLSIGLCRVTRIMGTAT